MTTVCWSGDMLAADTLFVSGTRKLQGDYEKILLPGDNKWTVNGMPILAFAIAGNVNSLPSIKNRLVEGVTHGTDPQVGTDSFQLLLVSDSKIVWYWNYGITAQKDVINELFKVEGNHAIGSGTPYGLGIMAIKGNAVDGVIGAMKVDVHTGGLIDVWKFDDPLVLYRIDPKMGSLTKEEAKRLEENGESVLAL